MALTSDRKLYLGPRLRVLRRELGLNQTQMAEELGVSASYLNHLERNQRPFTAQMLLRLAHSYEIDVRDFVAGANEAAASDLHEIFADALVRNIGIPRHEVLEVAENYPSVAEAVTRLYRALVDLRHVPERVESATFDVKVASPLGWLRGFLDSRHNHFAEIDEAAEALSERFGTAPEDLRDSMVRQLAEAHGISVRVMPAETLPGLLRHYDYHRRRLILSERLPPPSRLFGVAYQVAMLELASPIETVLAAAAPPDAETAALGRIALTDYASAALLMPYARFHSAAEASRYDLDLLAARFGASYEQVAHRLTTLGRHGSRGVPFFLLKLDIAGNVSKRFGSEALPLARFGGGCPRWRVHRSFQNPGTAAIDWAEMPDGSRYFTLGRAAPRVGATELVAIVLGCDAKHMPRLRNADGIEASRAHPTPIGPACHVCERPACPERSLPPITRALALSPVQRPSAPYPFREA